MNMTIFLSRVYLRVAEEKEAQDRIGSEEVNEGAAQTPACER